MVLLLLACLTSLVFGASFHFGGSFTMPEEDPYKVLGIKRHEQNNMDAIKKAYREKAKLAHPDKNPNLDPEIANQRFHRINSAYEYLSNKDQKLYYDRRQNTHHQQRQQEILRKKEEERRRREEERRQHEEEKRREREIRQLSKEAQVTMLKISSLEDLVHKFDVVDKHGKFQTNFLCVFVSNKKIEQQAETEFFFPYPFGNKGRNDIDWTLVLKTAKVRFNKATPLTEAFGVPLKLSRPHIVFVPEGTLLDNLKPTISYTPGRKSSVAKFEAWVMNQLRTTVTVVNRNPEQSPSLKVYFAESTPDSKTIRLRTAGKHVAPGYMLQIPAKLSDRLVVLDESTNEFVGSFGATRNNEWTVDEHVLESIVMDDIVVSKKQQTVNVGAGHGTTRTCYDLSIACHSWIQADPATKCQRFSTFAHSMCAKSCGVCIESPHWNGLYYAVMHTPLHRVPKGLPLTLVLALREAGNFVRMMSVDFLHLWTMRRNVTAAFILGGLLLGIQIVLFAQMLLQGNTRATHKNAPSLLVVGLWFYTTGVVACLLLFVYQARPHDLLDLPGLVSFHWDLVNLVRNHRDIAVLFVGIGAASLVVCKGLTYPLRPSWMRSSILVSCTIVVSVGTIVGITTHLDTEKMRSAYTMILHQKWDMALRYYKNVAVALVVFGHLVGTTALTLLSYLRYTVFGNFYLVASIVNLVVGWGLLSRALQDRFFLQDFEHVTSMRMSAAVPCCVVGVLLGMTVGHRLFGETKRKTNPSQHYPMGIKAKIE